jgi:hypothetical protein
MNRAKELFRSYKFATFIGLTIAISVVLVSIAMFMYYKTDAYRLDLSRPEYASRRKQISKDANEKSHEFDAQGTVNKDTLKEFLITCTSSLYLTNNSSKTFTSSESLLRASRATVNFL